MGEIELAPMHHLTSLLPTQDAMNVVFVAIMLGIVQSADDKRRKFPGGALDGIQGGNLCLPSLLTTVKEQETRLISDWRNSDNNCGSVAYALN